MSQFLLKKQQLQAMLASAKNPQEFHKILDKSSSTFSQEDSYAESDDSTTNYYKKKKKKKLLYSSKRSLQSMLKIKTGFLQPMKKSYAPNNRAYNSN